MDKKNIDKLFQEKFKTFREIPDEKVWTAIENSLDKKRKKRVLPIWWSLGGVAAVLAIALLAFYTLPDTTDETPTITDIENKSTYDLKEDDSQVKTEQSQKKDAFKIPNPTEDAAAESEKKKTLESNGQREVSPSGELVESDNSSRDTKLDKNRKEHQDDIVKHHNVTEKSAVTSNENVAPNKNTEKYDALVTKRDSVGIVQSSSAITSLDTMSLRNRTERKLHHKEDSDILSPENNALAISDGSTNSSDNDESLASNIKNTNRNKNEVLEIDEGSVLAGRRTDNDVSNKINTTKTENKGTKRDSEGLYRTNPDILPERSQTGVVQNQEKEKGTIAKDSVTSGKKKSIFEALEAEDDEESFAEVTGSRWSAGPNVAPVYFDAIGEGSPIDPGFSSNAKSGNTNFSYGITVAYAMTKKLSVRSGLLKAEYGYDTNNVGFSPTLAASNGGRLENVEVVSGSNNFDSASPESVFDNSSISTEEFSDASASRNGNVSQQFGYLEVPLELDYALLDRRFGIHVIGGVSSLFLINNSVTLSSEQLTTGIGEASNLNDVNFSTNIGFGVNYRFTPKLQLNIEPVFKYQLNTFSNVSGDFRPFSLGVYSGLNFRF